MKLTTIPFAIIFSIFLTACGSDELTKDKAADIARDCESQSEKPVIETTFDYGKVRVNTTMNKRFGDKMEKYYKFQELRLVTIDKIATESLFGGKTEIFNIELTPKANKLLVGDVKERSGALSAKFRTCEYRFKKIRKVQNLPESNTAKVKLVIERLNESPFYMKKMKNEPQKKS